MLCAKYYGQSRGIKIKATVWGDQEIFDKEGVISIAKIL